MEIVKIMDSLNVIVGLGNPGPKYCRTWHNCGFMALEYLAQKYDIPIRTAKHKSLIGKGIIVGKPTLLVCPQTFMNLSGEAVRAIRDFYKLPLDKIMIVYDDLDLPVGATRLRLQGSAGTHNGMRSIVQQIGSGEFPRMRLGIGPKPEYLPLVDYVLSKVGKAQEKPLFAAIEHAAAGLEAWLSGDIDSAMRLSNGKWM